MRKRGVNAPRKGDQATCARPNTGSGRSWVARALASRSPAMSRQEPQVAPQPVRMVSSATVLTPWLAASRIWWSVTPLQMQTYTGGNRADRPEAAWWLFQWKREWLSIRDLNHSRYRSAGQLAGPSPVAFFGQYPRVRGRLRGRSCPAVWPGIQASAALLGMAVTPCPATPRASGARCRRARA